MKTLMAVTAAAAVAASGLAAPVAASAQPRGVVYKADPCRAEKKQAGATGAVLGGIAGAVIGSQVAGRGARTEGAVIGGVGGAVVGNQIGRHSVKCVGYPRGRHASRSGCRWINDRYQGRNYSYEICRGRDGYWRPV